MASPIPTVPISRLFLVLSFSSNLKGGYTAKGIICSGMGAIVAVSLLHSFKAFSNLQKS